MSSRHIWKLSGYAPALPTPFDKHDAIDAAAFEHFCELQISNGATALVVGATTGEAANLSREEHRKLLRIAIGVSRCRVPIIEGAGSNSTEHAIELTKDAETSGADAILSVVPYYNRPTQAGLYAHFSEIASSTSLPSSFMTCPRERHADLLMRPLRGWLSYPGLRDLRTPPATQVVSRACECWSERTSGFSREMTPPPWRSSLKVVMAAFRSPRMLLLVFAATCS
jgi:Dihydrodipicolinate synthetase family